ncbi:Hypothetical predicted protein [Mytilus galloprovincialis]|nr:Hypothetical predicted protein [Mytilus galloprovincialis]
MLYHLWKNNTKCCKCQPDFIFPCNAPLIMESEWKKMFSSTLPPCENDRKRPVNGAISICSFSALPIITVQQIHSELQEIIIQYCCSTRKSVQKLTELRNVTYGHVKKASMSCTEFNTFMSEAEDAILDIATVCGKEDYYKQMLLDLRDKPLDTRMFCQYEKVLLQTISNYEDIMESLQNSNADMKENIERLCRLQTEGSKRQRLIGETSAELDHHRKDQTYTEIKAVTACLQMLDNSKVLILSGREGSGKSKNSLEILRRIKEKHPETDVIKLKRLTQFSDIIKEDAVTVVLFEDVFGRITKQFCENTDEPILDSLHSYIKLGNVKVIFVMCNTVKQECQSLLSSHDIFYNNIAYLDLNSEEFELSYKEKESILVNYCTKNEIDIIYKDDSFNHNDRNIDKIKVSSIDKPDVSCRMSADNKCLVINCSAIEEMISSDPYQGFPECCRLFTRNKNITKLGATYFRYPLKSLLKEIESMRMEGKANDVKGLKYVILLYILLNQAQSAGSLQTESHDRVLMSINENGIDVLAHQTLFKECYSRNIGLNVHDIMYLCEELTCRYLTRKENTIYFQHRTFQDSVLISYCKINPKAIIPLLSIDHMVDIVRPQNYMEQEEEIFIKIPTIYYPELAVKIISFFYSDQRYAVSYRDKLMESKIISANDEDLIYELIKCMLSISKAVDFLLEQRNLRFAHVPEAKISDRDFKVFLTDIETHLLGIACVCGKETHVKKNLRDLHLRPLSINMLSKYEKLLHKNMEAINKNVASEHIKTRKNVSYKLRKLENRIESLETSSIEIKLEVQGLRKVITGETSAEIDNHRKDQTYTEIKAVAACVQMLDNSKVLILSGREGSGKSRNSLEILRQMKDKHPEIDVIKLTRLSQFSGINEKDEMTIMLFEDVFGRISKQFCENTDVQILDCLHSYINLGTVKVIFVMRNNVKQECKSILSSHEIFCKHIAYLDLSSIEFGLSLKEKEQIFINYCTKNRIEIIYKKEPSYYDAMWITIDKIKVPIVEETDVSCRSADNTCIVFNSWSVENMIRSDPYQGFPEYCRLFTRNKNITRLGVTYFKYPLKSLLKEIENMRMEGKANDVKGLKYVILLYILLNLENDRVILPINEINIDVQAHQKLFNKCYNKNIELKFHDIIYLCEELTCRYLTRKENKIYFQHRALQDSVLISYCNINPKAIIPLLSIDHMVDIVRPQNYMEQEDEMVIKIPKSNYYELAKKIVSLMKSVLYSSYRNRFIESKIITDNDNDLIYELLGCINRIIDTSSQWYSLSRASYIRHYFPLYLLLRNIGKLNDKTLTVNHTKNQMLISINFRDKNISLRVDPDISLYYAFESKYIDIIKWLIKNSDHSLIGFNSLFAPGEAYVALKYVECVQFLLENVKHDKFDMTQLFMNVFCSSNKEEIHAIYWMVDNVDTSLIDYDQCIDTMLGRTDSEMFVDLILYIVKKESHECLNINNVLYNCCKYGLTDALLKVLQNVDPDLFEKGELINNMRPDTETDDEDCWNKIVELILPWMKNSDFIRFFKMAVCYCWYSVLELLIAHISDLSIDIVQLVEKIFKQWDDDEEEEDVECDYELMENVFRLLLKYHSDNIGVAELIMKKACQNGSNCVVEELLLEKFDNISYYLNITLDKCLSQQLDGISISNGRGYGKLLMLFIQRVNSQFIDLNSLMNDLCHIGHSSAVLWLLGNQQSHCFDIRNVMNKASYHGDLGLVKYLKQYYKAGDFDYKAAMIKACRNSQEETLDVCEWLWANINHDMFDMKAALNNASRHDNTLIVEWILTYVDKGLLDTANALFCACEHGSVHTVKLLLDKSGINTFNFQHAITLACKNENNGYTIITKLLYERADKSIVDMNVVLSVACKNYRSHIVQWMVETCDQNMIVTETRDGNKNLINSLDKHLLDISLAINCIVDMDPPKYKIENVEATKKKLLCIILKKSNLRTIDLNKLLTESCKKDWLEIFICIFGKVDNLFLNIREAINVACQCGALNIVKWSLQNIDVKLLAIENVMAESCAYGWLECLVLIQKRCCHYAFNFQHSMVEACTYGRLEIVEWLLQNVNYECFHLPLLLQEAARNGWMNIINWLVKTFQIRKSDLHVATHEAFANDHLQIVVWMVSVLGRECIEFSSVADKIYSNSGNEAFVTFIFEHFDPRVLDIATVFTNACKFGWKDTAYFILDNDLSSLCDFNLAFNKACDNGETEIVKLLLERVDHHILDVKKAMQSVAVKGWDEIALLLLDKVEHTRLDIENALIEACRHGEIDVVQAIFQKVENNMIDVKAALDKACENHMHEELVLWVLENIDQEQADLKTVKIQAIRHKWRKVQFALTKVDIENLNEVEQDTETDNIIFLE